MNKQATLESLKQQVVALQEKIEAFENEEEEQGKNDTPWALSKKGEGGYGFNGSLNEETIDTYRYANSLDYNSFKEKSVAQGFANAFHVMVALRQCEGAGQFEDEEIGHYLDIDGYREESSMGCYEHFALFPPFSSAALAIAAADKVGRDKIAAAYKFLATGK